MAPRKAMSGRSILEAACLLALAAPSGARAEAFPPFPELRSFLELQAHPRQAVVPIAAPVRPPAGSVLPVFRDPSVGGPSSLDGWERRDWRGKATIEIGNTEIGAAFHLKSESSSSALYKRVSFSAQDYPILRWRWKAVELPRGGDVRSKSKDDAAVQLYVVFPYGWPETLRSNVVGYVWDATAPEGTAAVNEKWSNIRYIVVRSGAADLGRWLSEERNVLEDYRRLFNQEPPAASALSVMIDSDDTGSSAESFIGDISLSAGL